MSPSQATDHRVRSSAGKVPFSHASRALLLAILLSPIAPQTALAEEPQAEPEESIQEASVPEEPFPLQSDQGLLRVVAYALPPTDVSWITDERFERRCTLNARFALDSTLTVEPADCSSQALPSCLDAARRWRFEWVEPPPAVEPPLPSPVGSFQLTFVLRYEEKVQVLTMHAIVDPGKESAFEGASGPPGVKLAHSSETTREVPVKLSGKQRKQGMVAGSCAATVRVDPDGRARDPILAADCPDPLDQALAKAISKWRFSPRVVDGVTEPELRTLTLTWR